MVGQENDVIGLQQTDLTCLESGDWFSGLQAFHLYRCVHSGLRDVLLTFTWIYCGSHVRMNTVSVSVHMLHTSLRPLGCILSLFLIKCLSVLKSNIKWFSKPIYYCWRSWKKACLCSYTPMSRSNNLWRGYAQKSIRKCEEDVEKSPNDATSVARSHVCLGFSCKLHPNAKQLQVSRPKTRSVIPLSL